MYQALYRKYRPKDFDSVVGQDPIIKTLKNSIINKNFSHAYMFFGSRGTGKTTVSKIFARNVNCENPIDGIACGKCNHCKVSFSNDCIDIIEIDAASNNGVDEIRELRNKITLVPSELKYKVYIIDEVHMLSIGAFNALLKTLEEPPEHAIFILATTDPQKVPETIISRCQCFSFKRISTDTIKNRLDFVCKEENIKIDEEVLDSIALLSDGGLRDALGLLDKLVSYTDKKITMDDFIEVNGIVSNEQVSNFINNIMNGNIKEVLNDINNFDNCGKNLIQIITQILNYSRKMIVDYYISNTNLDYSIDLLQVFTNLINEKMFDIKKSSNTRIYIEMVILKFINDNILDKTIEKVEIKQDNEKSDIKEIDNNMSKEEKNVENKPVESDNSSNLEDDEDYDFSKEFGDDEEVEDYIDTRNVEKTSISIVPKMLNIKEIMDIRVNNTLALADKNLLKEENSKFDLLRDYTFDQKIGYIVCDLLDSKVRAVSPNNMIISFEYDSTVEQNLQIIDKIMDVYSKITNSTKNIAIISDSEWEKVKNEYIENLKNKVKYEVKEEPEVIFEELDKSDIISSSAVELFGSDIVEME